MCKVVVVSVFLPIGPERSVRDRAVLGVGQESRFCFVRYSLRFHEHLSFQLVLSHLLAIED